MTKTIHVPDNVHKLIKDNKGGRTMGKVVEDIFGEHFQDKPTNPERVFYKCDTCKKIEGFNAPWDIGYSPEVDKIMKMMGKLIGHKEYGAKCDGILKLYNIDIIQNGEEIKKENVLLKVVVIDERVIIVSKTKDQNNPRVGEIIEPIPGHLYIKIISIEDLYKIVETLAKYYEPGFITGIVEQLKKIKFEPDKNRFLTNEIHAQVQQIFNSNKIIPEGMFKFMCYLIPSFCYSLSQTTLTDNEGNMSKAPIGDGFFRDLVTKVANREITHNEAMTYYRGIRVNHIQ